ncbi:MAG: methyltransferase [Marinobacter sp. 34-60-7]|nr:MAG: methyltransferase [Marinobacter sp. 34-60-7]
MTTLILDTPGGPLRLQRPGATSRDLRAWDAADELLIGAAAEVPNPSRPLVVDDAFGALSLALTARFPGCSLQSVADSALAADALASNARLNRHLPEPDAVHSWRNPPAGPFDLIVLRIPRQADYLAWLLRWANGVLAPEGRILAGGMIKHLPDRSVDVFADAVITEHVLPARKKARVVVCKQGDAPLDTWPGHWRGYAVPGLGAAVQGLPAVFAREKLDVGTAELLPLMADSLAALAPGARVLDLACGNGVLGLSALSRPGDLELDFSDVSSQAVVSVEHNLARLTFTDRARVFHADGVPEAAGRYPLILLNPPFHEGGVVGDHIALRLFEQASEHLTPGGRLLMVGNRHLGYHRSLGRFFRHVQQRGASPRFVVFEAFNQP